MTDPQPNPATSPAAPSTHYQVVCVCGHRFYVPGDTLNRQVPCPQCNRALIPVPPDASPAAPAAAEPTKRCAFCGETILAIARKCRFCGEFLDRAAPGPTPAPEPAEAAAAREEVEANAEPVFVLSVSQWDNFFRYTICITIAVITGVGLKFFAPVYAFPGTMGVSVLMVFVMYFYYLAARNARCTIRPARLETETGLFSKHTDTLELWRVIDITLKQGAIERVLGIGTILLKTTDEDSPVVELYQIPKARKVFKYLQEQVPKIAKERGVVYIEK